MELLSESTSAASEGAPPGTGLTEREKEEWVDKYIVGYKGTHHIMLEIAPHLMFFFELCSAIMINVLVNFELVSFASICSDRLGLL